MEMVPPIKDQIWSQVLSQIHEPDEPVTTVHPIGILMAPPDCLLELFFMLESHKQDLSPEKKLLFTNTIASLQGG
jgi:hypothetical protein